MKKKIVVLILSMALLVGFLSGCTEEEEETENTAPEAYFTFEVDGATMTTSFDSSESLDADGDELTYTWDFGDGNTGEGLTPTNVYAENGSYTVTLTVNDGTEDVVVTETVDINVEVVPTMPTASFTYDPMINITNATEITFADTSELGDATTLTYMWDFGDETNSTEEAPTHAYAAEGTYEVTLTVTDETDATLTDMSDTTTITVVTATT